MHSLRLRASGTLQEIDAAEVRRAASILFSPDSTIMIQGLPCGRYQYVRAGDSDAVVAAVQSLADQNGIYWTINPCPSGLTRCARSSDMLERRWLLVDCDPHGDRPADGNSSESEHNATQDRAVEIMDWLSERGWPLPVGIDSGNGWHLLYRVELPNTALSQALVRRVIHAIGDRFDQRDDNGRILIQIDRAVHDAKRIAKIPGTWARRGPASADRPHRQTRIVYCPEVIETVTVEQLQSLADTVTPRRETQTAPAPAAAPTLPSSSSDRLRLCASHESRRQYAEAALRSEVAAVRMSSTGTRNTRLFRGAAACGNFVAANLLIEQDVISALTFAGLMVGLPENEVASVVKRGLEKGKETPRNIPSLSQHVPPANGVIAHNMPAPAAPDRDEPKTILDAFDTIIVRATTITPRKLAWLWPGRIPLGKLTTFAGIGGLGKTFVLCDITARITSGSDWPDGGGECAEPGQVLFISGEDDHDDTIVPRLVELGANLDHVVFLRTEVQDLFTLADLPVLDRALDEAGDGVRFVAIDPPTAFLGGVDDHRNAELRALLSPLKTWAARRRVAVVFNTHVNKPQGKVEAMMRVMGSVAWVNAVRAAHLFARDPDDPERRIFCCMKMNIARERKGLAYRLVSHGDMARIEWLGEVDTTADEAINAISAAERHRVNAAEWLIEQFRSRYEWPSDELKRAASECGIPKHALWAAKNQLGVRHKKTISATGDVIWQWWVPPDWPPFAAAAGRSSRSSPTDHGGDDESIF